MSENISETVSNQSKLEIINTLKQKHENTVVFMGITLAMVLVLFFFSFAQLIDRLPPIFIQVQVMMAIFIVIALCYIKRLAFFYLRLRHGMRTEFKPFLSVLNANDMAKESQVLLDEKFSS